MRTREVDENKLKECIDFLLKVHIGFIYKGYTIELIDCYSDVILSHIVNFYRVYYDGTSLIIDFEILR